MPTLPQNRAFAGLWEAFEDLVARSTETCPQCGRGKMPPELLKVHLEGHCDGAEADGAVGADDAGPV
jgi:uncharacterized protein (DUF983 family)